MHGAKAKLRQATEVTLATSPHTTGSAWALLQGASSIWQPQPVSKKNQRTYKPSPTLASPARSNLPRTMTRQEDWPTPAPLISCTHRRRCHLHCEPKPSRPGTGSKTHRRVKDVEFGAMHPSIALPTFLNLLLGQRTSRCSQDRVVHC